MPKYYCDYCDTHLTHDSPSVRKTHCTGRKHKDNVKFYYQKWMEEQAQHLIDATTAAYKASKLPMAVPGMPIPPPHFGMPLRPGMPHMMPPPMGPGGPMPPMMMGPGTPMPPMMGMPPPHMMGMMHMRPPVNISQVQKE
ncbi:U1 small nuclear ribonucleoprotein C-like [Aethina tumida]|uniref:U1 small nuclear ribonucleoprotein C-like n=1 Tax=Aethina tumida TaxID=116153 RepID=UPI0021487CBB|nr:U1 small nuclear ribonucleoprotein C-like [Aethina tumida]XP_049820233.1 U1 small nuclear ribonucleoprotein C-like [Aethina tumida]